MQALIKIKIFVLPKVILFGILEKLNFYIEL